MVTDFFLEKCYVKNKIYVECTKNYRERIIIELKHYFASMEIWYQYFICKVLQLGVIVIIISLLFLLTLLICYCSNNIATVFNSLIQTSLS